MGPVHTWTPGLKRPHAPLPFPSTMYGRLPSLHEAASALLVNVGPENFKYGHVSHLQQSPNWSTLLDTREYTSPVPRTQG